jgi:hypothetical protein
MDKKYKAILTLKDLDLSRGTRSTIGSGSGNSQVVKDFLSEEKAKSKSKEKVVIDFLKDLPPLKPKKLPPLELKTPLLLKPTPPTTLKPLKPKKLPPLEGKIINPKTGREVSLEYYKKLVKSGEINETIISGEKTEKINFFSPPPPLEKPSFSTDYKEFKGNIFSRESWFKVDEEKAFLLNKNTPTDPKYKKEQQEKLEDYQIPEYISNRVIGGYTIGDIHGIYDDPERLLKAKPVIDKRLKEWEEKMNLEKPVYDKKLRKWVEEKDIVHTPKVYNPLYSSPGSTPKNWRDYIKTLPSSRLDKEWLIEGFDVSPSYFSSSPPKPKPATPPKKKSASPPKPKSATPPKKTRGRPKGSLNKPKKKSSS